MDTTAIKRRLWPSKIFAISQPINNITYSSKSAPPQKLVMHNYFFFFYSLLLIWMNVEKNKLILIPIRIWLVWNWRQCRQIKKRRRKKEKNMGKMATDRSQIGNNISANNQQRQLLNQSSHQPKKNMKSNESNCYSVNFIRYILQTFNVLFFVSQFCILTFFFCK